MAASTATSMGGDACPNSSEKTCILWQNEDHTVTLLDVPCSIELAQQFEHGGERKLWSSSPLEQPYPSLEPKSEKALTALKSQKAIEALKNPDTDINDLILHRVLALALEEAEEAIGDNGDSPQAWCLPRSCYDEKQSSLQDDWPEKRHHIKHKAGEASNIASSPPPPSSVPSYQYGNSQGGVTDSLPLSPFPLFQNTMGRTVTISLPGSNIPAIFPVNSTHIPGEIIFTLPIFIQKAPRFPLIILDPPWPNRSARRAGHYHIAYGLSEIGTLLSGIPIRSKLEKNGLVGVWITNKEIFRGLLLGKDGERGLFGEWGIELVEEWVWLKITGNGEPMSPIDGTWRKPFEILLVGRRIPREEINIDPCEVGSKTEFGEVSDERKGREQVGKSGEQPVVQPTPVKRRVIIAVPDMHSRKPNLMALFAPLLPSSLVPPHCLEIFARNLTAHSWAWGNEVLEFQRLEHWTECADTSKEAGNIEKHVAPV
ncbi:hypothetical protein VC83_02527 [Pseudogymnoascus destructans]|uniref:Methyltransferase-like protein 4 n=2 Tax=Pseudogymnoascus destructans TaxID=655981 RepID=L8FQK4_PSED2|nr:uncharacterized protein VC83_02527 [Pseudogymnoascus destructans]ELR01986.1 hypothetical protein GMDG_05155 [Pseudogymnoascus destructans 20631-21]OAF60936.1 hypothetical protein VC83_02527 [Pseudogymnoascus destructans]